METTNGQDKDPLSEETIRAMTEILIDQIKRRNQVIRELLQWIDAEFRLDQYPPDSPGRQLWERAIEAIKFWQ
jgi:hypothetical protein